MTEEREKELLDRIAKLEARLDPPPKVTTPARRFDPTAQMSLPTSAIAEMTKATAGVMADVVADSRRHSTREPADAQPHRVPSDNGWRETALPLVPPGTRYIDALTGGDAKPYRRNEG